jgi:molecular chaperone GrpE
MSAKQQTEKEVLPEEQVVEGELLEAEVKETGEEAGEQSAARPEESTEQQESSDIDAHQQEIEHLKTQAQESLDKAIRAQAELDNVRKRTLRDVENAHKYALEKFVNELLPVMDSMELGINAAESADEKSNLKEGMDLTLKMFRDALEKFGVVEVESLGVKFDPEKHEAVSMQELEGAEAGTVGAVLQKGYTLNDRLIRPAMVVVAK